EFTSNNIDQRGAVEGAAVPGQVSRTFTKTPDTEMKQTFSEGKSFTTVIIALTGPLIVVPVIGGSFGSSNAEGSKREGELTTDIPVEPKPELFTMNVQIRSAGEQRTVNVDGYLAVPKFTNKT